MKLLTKEVEQRFRRVGSQAGAEDPLALVKFFTPDAGGTWFALEMWYVLGDGTEVLAGSEGSKDVTSESPGVKDVGFYGWAQLFPGGEEFGDFMLSQLQSIRGALHLPVERDIGWKPRPISEAIRPYVR